MNKKEDLTYYETKLKLIKQIQLMTNNMTVSELDFLIQYIEYWDCKPFFSREVTEEEIRKMKTKEVKGYE